MPDKRLTAAPRRASQSFYCSLTELMFVGSLGDGRSYKHSTARGASVMKASNDDAGETPETRGQQRDGRRDARTIKDKERVCDVCLLRLIKLQ